MSKLIEIVTPLTGLTLQQKIEARQKAQASVRSRIREYVKLRREARAANVALDETTKGKLALFRSIQN